MSWKQKGSFTEQAKAAGKSPAQYARDLWADKRSILGAAIKAGVAPHTIRYWLAQPIPEERTVTP